MLMRIAGSQHRAGDFRENSIKMNLKCGKQEIIQKR